MKDFLLEIARGNTESYAAGYKQGLKDANRELLAAARFAVEKGVYPVGCVKIKTMLQNAIKIVEGE